MPDDLTPLESVAASGLVSASLIASLIPTLVDRGVLSAQDAREVYEQALRRLETQRSSEPAMQRIYEAAREMIEAHLRAR